MLYFAIMENNKTYLDNLLKMLNSIFIKYDLNAEVKLSTTDSSKLLNYINNNRVDVLFLDMDLQDPLKGLEIAKKIRENNKDCYLILNTSHIEYALTGYKYKTFDFIYKPVSYSRLEDCIIRLFDDLSSTTSKFIKLNNKNTILAESEIKYIEKMGTKIIFHTNDHDYETYNSFCKIQDKLPSNFIRCHKSFIANINNITKVEAADNIIYFDEFSCDIGPKYKNDFLEVISNYEKSS